MIWDGADVVIIEINVFESSWEMECACVGKVASVVFNSFWPYGLYPARLLCPWDAPGRNTRVSCRALLQEFFPTQELNLCLVSAALAGSSLPPVPPGKLFPALSVNKDATVIRDSSPPNVSSWAPRAFRKEKNAGDLAAIRTATTP